MKKLLAGLLFSLLLSSSAVAVELQDKIGGLYRKGFDNSLRFTCTVSAIWPFDAEYEELHVDDTILLTADHCVSRFHKYYYVTFDGMNFYVAELYKVPRELPEDPEVDMALLIIRDHTMPTLDLSITPPKPGSNIVSIGFPLGVSKILYKGYLAGHVDNLGSNVHGYLILQTFGAPGSSGTSVLNAETNEVIGVLVGAAGGRIGLPVIFATPIEYMKYLVTPEEKREMKSRYYDD